MACLLLKGHTVFHPRHFKDPDGYQLEAAVDLMSKSLGQTVELSYKQVVDNRRSYLCRCASHRCLLSEASGRHFVYRIDHAAAMDRAG